jgi:hypothetical protein
VPRNKKKHDDLEDYAGSAVAFAASLDRDATLHAHAIAVEATCAVDCGAICLCSRVRSDFANLRTSSMDTVNGIGCEVEGLGDVVINVCNTQGNFVFIFFKDVIFFPAPEQRSRGVYLRLMSVRRATRPSFQCTFSRDEDNLVLPARLLVKLVRFRGLTWLPNFALPLFALPTSLVISRNLVHRRCGHL